jgi:hypothetical protein
MAGPQTDCLGSAVAHFGRDRVALAILAAVGLRLNLAPAPPPRPYSARAPHARQSLMQLCGTEAGIDV